MSPPLPALAVNDDLISEVSTQGTEDDEVAEPDGENQLSDQQLRDLYDEEEIKRFMNLFSATVTEIRINDTPSAETPPLVAEGIPCVKIAPGNLSGDDSGDSGESQPLPSRELSAPVDLCRTVIERYILPYLPPQPVPQPVFTLGRLRITTQRLYLSIEPTYVPFLTNLMQLATWQDRGRSTKFCILFWVLWYHNLLLPALVLRILYALVVNRIFRHPTLSELRIHRQEIERADKFGEEIQARLSSSSILEVKEMWRMLAMYRRAKKVRIGIVPKENRSPNTNTKNQESHDEPTVLDNPKESNDEHNIKRAILCITSDIADLHERVKNIFLWRRPASSRLYGMVLTVLFFMILLVPAHYLAKLFYFVAGSLFWHVTPLLAALSPSERSRLPPPFVDVPTDADYAMELISNRIATGLPVKPDRRKKNRRIDNPSPPSDTQATREREDEPSRLEENQERKFDWKKWGERAAAGKALVGDTKRLIAPSEGLKPSGSSEPQRAPSPVDLQGHRGQLVGTHTFPATYNAIPGLITLTNTDVLFTPLLSLDPKVVIPLNNLRGVKKAGIIKGLILRWIEHSALDTKVEKEEKFLWVGGRDELFARLLGTDARRWIRA